MTEKTQCQSRKERIIAYIRAHTADKHYPPTIREIGKAIGVRSTSLIDRYLNSLVADGLIGRNKHIARGIWVRCENEKNPLYD